MDTPMTPDECAELRRKHYNATVASVRRAHDDLIAVRIRPDFAIPEHKPGQYSTLGLGAWELGGVVWDRHYPVTLLSDARLRALLEELGLAEELEWSETRTGFFVDGGGPEREEGEPLRGHSAAHGKARVR